MLLLTHVLVILLANLQHPKCLEKCHILSQIMKLNIHMLNVFQIMPTTLPNAIMHVNQHNTIQYSIVQYSTIQLNTILEYKTKKQTHATSIGPVSRNCGYSACRT